MRRSGGQGAIVVAALMGLLGLIGVATVRGQTQPGTRVPMAEEVFKNIQVLKGIPEDEFMGTMGIFASSLGKNCSECHGEESGGNWALYAKDTPLKLTARRMVLMTKQINDTSFGGRQVVTCYSCHRGLARPKVTPSLVALYGVPPDEPDDVVVASPNAPKADEIFDKYLAAIGGAARVAALTSYSAKGTYMAFDDAEAHPLEVSVKAPNQRSWLWHTGFGDHSMVFNGRDGWVTATQAERPFPVELMSGQELDGTRLEAELAFPTRIKQALTGMRVGLPVSIGDRDANVIQGRTAAGTLVSLYFDMQTGLLTRLMRYSDSP